MAKHNPGAAAPLVAAVLVRLFLTVCLHASAQKAKRIYLAPDDHTDYMWTADEAAYRDAFVEDA